MPANDVTAPKPRPNPIRSFGRFELRQLLGKSAAAMVWLAFDPNLGSEVMITLPRLQPVDSAALELWVRDVTQAARIDHPNLAPVREIGVQDHWPYVTIGREQGVTLGEWIAAHPNTAPDDAAAWVSDALRGMAFAHDAGVAHRDLQLHSLLINERGGVSVMALCTSGVHSRASDAAGRTGLHQREAARDPSDLHAQRAAAERDVMACGLLLHHLIAGKPPLEQPDTALAMARMTPIGRELLRLPWSTPRPIPEALRAISNRCTSTQERLRYRSARTLLGALVGWRESQAQDGGGPLALLLDRLRTVGHLPALPGFGALVSRLTSGDGQRTDEIAALVLDDLALSLELLRTLNSAQVQGTQEAGASPVLTLRRIISLIGVNGVRHAANTLREWPGPLSEAHSKVLKITLDRVRLAGHIAQALRPAGYDPEVVYLITVLQNLGRLMLRYHFADEAQQIHQLMQPSPGNRAAGTPEQPGLGEEAAAFAVLGVGIESLGSTVARHWGLSDDVLHMARRLPTDAPVRKPDGDGDALRITASAANEVVDAFSLMPTTRVPSALNQVTQRYARALNIDTRDLVNAFQAAPEALRAGLPMPDARRGAVIGPITVTDPLAATSVASTESTGSTGSTELPVTPT